MWDDYIKGETVILSIEVGGVYMPIACLTDNPFSRSVGFIETGGRGGGEGRSYLPTLGDYDLSCNGIVNKSTDSFSYKDLKTLTENRVIFNWRMFSADGYINESGSAFIIGLSFSAAANTWVGFSCTFKPAAALNVSHTLVWSENGLNIVSENGVNAIKI